MPYERRLIQVNEPQGTPLPKNIEHVHWPDAPNLWMPLCASYQGTGRDHHLLGRCHRRSGLSSPEELDAMPSDMEGQARAALENLQRGLTAVGAIFAAVVTADRFVTDLSDQNALSRVWAVYFGEAKPEPTTVQVVRLATDLRCLVEINAIAVTD